MKTFILSGLILSCAAAFGQQPYYDVVAGSGNGVRFWQDDSYKIHMGTGAEYQYGPVSDYSIKVNMSNHSARGWTWGIVGLTPVAALNTIGNMQIAGTFTVSGNSNPINFTDSWTGSPDVATNVSEISNDAVNYQQLMIVGNKAQGADRRVGIWDRLSIKGAGFSQEFNVNGGGYFSGNVGIGTSSPQWLLDVNGGIAARGQVVIDSTPTEVLIGDLAAGDGTRDKLLFFTRDTKQMTLDENGNLGIGTALPNEKLTVNGTIYGREVKVDLSVPGPDYVFKKDYHLRPLEELEQFIDRNNHLPEVPSAEQMQEKGIELGAMNMLLLKKVEELTLYVIQLQKENERQDSLIQKLETKPR